MQKIKIKCIKVFFKYSSVFQRFLRSESVFLAYLGGTFS